MRLHTLCIVAALSVSWSSCGQAQEPSDGAEGQEQQERAPAEALPLPFPVEIVEDEAETEARQRHEAEARERDIANLRAQQGLNEATQAMKLYSLLSTIFVGIGTILVWISLRLMRRANQAAVAAVEVTRDIGQRQIRAYMVADTTVEWGMAFHGKKENIVGYNFNIKWKNSGQSPARRSHARTSLGIFDALMPEDFDFPDKATPSTVSEKMHIGPGQSFNSRVGGLSTADAMAVEAGTKHAYIWSWIEYDDIFGKSRRRTEVCYKLQISGGLETLTPTLVSPFNGADEDCYHQPKT